VGAPAAAGFEQGAVTCPVGNGANSSSFDMSRWPQTPLHGEYQVQMTYPPSASASGSAQVNATDDFGTQLGNARVNEQVAPAGTTAEGVNWTTLFTVNTTSGLHLTLPDSPHGVTLADAFRVVPVGPLVIPTPYPSWIGRMLCARHR